MLQRARVLGQLAESLGQLVQARRPLVASLQQVLDLVDDAAVRVVTALQLREAPPPALVGAGTGLNLDVDEAQAPPALSGDDGLWFAVPKHRVTRSKKLMKMKHKWVPRKGCFAKCKLCGDQHMRHHLCPSCFPFNNYLLKKDIGKPGKTFEIFTSDDGDESAPPTTR